MVFSEKLQTLLSGYYLQQVVIIAQAFTLLFGIVVVTTALIYLAKRKAPKHKPVSLRKLILLSVVGLLPIFLCTSILQSFYVKNVQLGFLVQQQIVSETVNYIVTEQEKGNKKITVENVVTEVNGKLSKNPFNDSVFHKHDFSVTENDIVNAMNKKENKQPTHKTVDTSGTTVTTNTIKDTEATGKKVDVNVPTENKNNVEKLATHIVANYDVSINYFKNKNDAISVANYISEVTLRESQRLKYNLSDKELSEVVESVLNSFKVI